MAVSLLGLLNRENELVDEINDYDKVLKELEERLCPCEDHDWKLVNTDYRFGCCVEDIDTIYHYKCTRCGKELKTLFEKENTK
jgi:hypothetical protein